MRTFWDYCYKIDDLLLIEMRHWAIPALRIALGIIFLWFGALKVLNASPVVELIFTAYSFMPPIFIAVLGWWEIIIGVGLITKSFLRTTLILMWIQLAGTFSSFFLAPDIFFVGLNPFYITLEGEFVIKNLILVAAGLVIGGFEIHPFNHRSSA